MSHTRLRSARLARRQSHEVHNPFQSWIGLSVLAVCALGSAVAIWGGLARNQRMRQSEHWPTAAGTVAEERVIEDSYVSIRQSRFLRSYICQCRVEYSVAEKAYSVWATGKRDSDRTALSDCRQECFASSYQVRYDPKQPSDARAFIAATAGP